VGGDRDLVRRMLGGEEHAFDEFFETNFDRVFRFAVRRVGDSGAAEDIAQAAIVAAIRRLHTWRGEASLFTWLCAICRREIMAHVARTNRAPAGWAIDDEPAAAAVLEGLSSLESSPEQTAAHEEMRQRVRLTLDYLPGRYGDVLEWKYLEGLTVNEIAARLGLSPKAVESMLTRARAAFREGFGALPGAWEAP
jgi:RNA polymerase sigma-70 factor (ECF subfamily)